MTAHAHSDPPSTGIVTIPSADGWSLEHDGYDAARERSEESVFSLTNGFLGLRASGDEGSAGSTPALFMAGLYDEGPTGSEDLVIGPDIATARILVDGEALPPDRTLRRWNDAVPLRRVAAVGKQRADRPDVGARAAGGPPHRRRCPRRAASSARCRASLSMIVGTHGTGDGRYGPDPSFAGTQEGTFTIPDVGVARHGASMKLSQPQPGPVGFPETTWGLSPVNPSSV